MKKRFVKRNSKTEALVSKPLKANINIKNREQLRRKLRDLLEKDKTQNPKDIPIPKQNVYKKTSSAKVQEGSNLKIKEKMAKPPKAALKRKQTIPSLENNKLYKVSSEEKPEKSTTSKENPVQGRMKKKDQHKKSTGKLETEVPQPSPKPKKIKLLNSVSKQKLLNGNTQTKKVVKKSKQSDVQYRGPFRPDSDSSGDDDLVDSSGPHFDCDTQNQSKLISKNGDIESEISERSLTDEDFIPTEYSSTDSPSNYDTDSLTDEYSEEDSEYGSYSDSSDLDDFSLGESDSTYKLPNDVPEDIYVAKGEAIKHDLSESNEIAFDSEDSCAQIIEIKDNDKHKHVLPKVPKALTWKEDSSEKKTTDPYEESCESSDSCPELIPIGHDYNRYDSYVSESCSHCYDSESCSKSDYTDEESNEDATENICMVPQIFKGEKNASKDFDYSLLNTSDAVSGHAVEGSPLERLANNVASKMNYNIITVKNKKALYNEYESKRFKKVTMDIVKTVEKVVDNQNESIESNGSIDVIESNPRQDPKQVLQKNVDSPKTNDTLTVNNYEHKIIEKNEVCDITYQGEPTPANGSIKYNSQLKTLFFNAINSNQVIVLLKEPLYLYGTLKLKLLAGGVDIFGYNPKPNEMLEVFSPRGYASLKIEPSVKLNSHTTYESELNALESSFLKMDIENVKRNFNSKHDAILILERNDNSKKVNMLRKYMVEDLFPNMNLLHSDRPFYASEFLLRCVLKPTADKPLNVNPVWRTVPVNNASRIVVIGGKSVGKSSFVRFLSNIYLNKSHKVLLIDLDIGQPEMFVPQTVSATTLTEPLLGPGYLSVKEPDKAFLVGHINVVLLPQRYIQSVHALISFCNENPDYNNIPWIVNTMGYNKGFGGEIIGAISRLLNPTNIVQLDSKNEINNFDMIMSKENLKCMQFDIIGDMFENNSDYHPEHVLTLMSSVVMPNKKYQKDWDLKPRDIRLAMIISRLSGILTGQAEWLTEIKPVCASTHDLKLMTLGDENLSTEELLKSLVGNIVYLCKQNSSSNNECLGIGIVRGIDFPLKQLYLLPAISMKMLAEVNCLVISGIPMPSSILINQGPRVKGVASYIYNTIDRSASMHIKQIYNRPQHFLTGKHKSIIDS